MGPTTQPRQEPGTVACALQHKIEDPLSTIALEFKRACTMFGQPTETIRAEVVSQPEVVAFWCIREKSTTLDVVHCLAPFTPDTIGAPHVLKHKIIGFLGDRVAEQNPPEGQHIRVPAWKSTNDGHTQPTLGIGR